MRGSPGEQEMCLVWIGLSKGDRMILLIQKIIQMTTIERVPRLL